jgi:hypothetical protein
MMMKRNKLNVFAVGFFAVCLVFALNTDTVFAYDDFGRIVNHIEVNYHVHRNYRFVMGFAGLVVKFWHIGGVKSFKGAIFENQRLNDPRLVRGASDATMDEIVQRAGQSSWRPVVRSYSRRSNEHTYIYAQDAGKDLKLLIVNVEPNEAAVIQVKVDPDKLDQFLNENTGNGRHMNKAMMSFR